MVFIKIDRAKIVKKIIAINDANGSIITSKIIKPNIKLKSVNNEIIAFKFLKEKLTHSEFIFLRIDGISFLDMETQFEFKYFSYKSVDSLKFIEAIVLD